MSQPHPEATWGETLHLKTTAFDRIVPWVSRAQLVALSIVIKRGHPEEGYTVDLQGEPQQMSRVAAKASENAARKKMDLIAECQLQYLVDSNEESAQPCRYWDGFEQARLNGQVEVWDDKTGLTFKAEDHAAKASYEKKPKQEAKTKGKPPPFSVEGRVRHLEAEVLELHDYISLMAQRLFVELEGVPTPPWVTSQRGRQT